MTHVIDKQAHEIVRLPAALHRLQKHPDFDYCMTFEGNTSHKSMDDFDWELNAELIDGCHGEPKLATIPPCMTG